jgi:C4-dicarboxylate-specific signal transduction histidine kinase
MLNISLKNKLVLSVVFVIFIFGSLATIFVFFYARDIFVNNLKENLKISAIEHTHEITLIFENSTKLVETISDQDLIIDYIKDEEKIHQDNNVLQLLEAYNIGDLYSAIYIMDNLGETFVSTDSSFVGKNYSFRDYFKSAIMGNGWVDVSLGVTSKKLGYYFSNPIFDEDGLVLGVVVIKMKPDFLGEYLVDYAGGDDSHIMFIDQDGIIVFADKEERIYKSLGKINDTKLKSIKDKKRYPNIEIESIQYDEIQKNIGLLGDLRTFEFFDKEDDELEILVITKVKNTPFSIIIEQELSGYIQQAFRIAGFLSLFVLVAAIVASVVISYLITRALRPILTLKEFSEKVSLGNLETRLDINTGDEIENLANSFNGMIDTLQKSRQNIEKKVQDRTKELEKLNKFMTGRELKMLELKEEIKKLNNKKTK